MDVMFNLFFVMVCMALRGVVVYMSMDYGLRWMGVTRRPPFAEVRVQHSEHILGFAGWYLLVSFGADRLTRRLTDGHVLTMVMHGNSRNIPGQNYRWISWRPEHASVLFLNKCM